MSMDEKDNILHGNLVLCNLQSTLPCSTSLGPLSSVTGKRVNIAILTISHMRTQAQGGQVIYLRLNS